MTETGRAQVTEHAAGGRLGGLTRGRALGFLLLASLVLVISGRTPWLLAASTTAIRSHQVNLTGSEVAPAVSAAALVGLAGVAALTIARGVGRRIVLIVLGLAGLLAIWAAATVLRNPADAAGSVDSGTGTLAAQTTPWPWLAVAAGLLLTVVAGLTWFAAPNWDVPKARFEAAPKDIGMSSAGDWDALTRGEDPTGESLAE